MGPLRRRAASSRSRAPLRPARWRPARGTSAGAVALMLCLSAAGCSSTAEAGRDASVQRAGTAAVALLPIRLGAGEGGWCLTTLAAGGGGCPTYALPARLGPFDGPIIVEHWSGRSGGDGAAGSATGVSVDEAIVLTTSEVMAVSIEGGPPVATHADVALPDQLRGADIELRGGSSKGALGINGPLPFPRSHFVALNAAGQAISQTHDPGPPLQFEEPRRSWGPNAPALRGVCRLNVSAVAGLASEGGSVVPTVEPHADVRGREFVDCIHVSYLVDNWPLQADVLLDAARPGTSPGPLPAMRSLPRQPGISVGPGAEGNLVARRLPFAWLVVEGGENLEQRLTLVKRLKVTLHL
jgi:hypothetical protein